MKRRKATRSKAVAEHHQNQISRIQSQCLKVKHETDHIKHKIKNQDKEILRLEKLVNLRFARILNQLLFFHIHTRIHTYTYTRFPRIMLP